MGIVFLFPTTPSTDTQDMNYTVVVLFGTLFLSLVWYYFPVYGGVHWFTGPVPTIQEADDGSSEGTVEGLEKVKDRKGEVGVTTQEV